MNKTGGFKTLKLRTASTSLRPQSSGYQETILNLLPLDISEQVHASSLKLDILSFEENIATINKLGSTRLSSTYIQKMKQWLQGSRTAQHIQEAQRIVQICNCNDTSEALVKLYNMIVNLDYYVNKLTELQCSHFMQYEQCFENLQSIYLQKIATSGIIPSRFHMSLLALEIIEYLVQRKNPQTGESELVTQLKSENLTYKIQFGKLNQEIEKLQNQCRKLQESNSTTLNTSQLSQSSNELPTNPNHYYQQKIDEIKDSYKNLISMIRDENQQLSLKLSDVQMKFSNINNENNDLKKEFNDLKQFKEDLLKRFYSKYKTQQEYEDSYEAALKEEYSQMEQSFRQKIIILERKLDEQNREYSKQIIEQKKIIDQLNDKERLLLKKLSMYQKL